MSTTGPDQVIRFRCQCGAVLAARSQLAGRKGKCKKCGSVLEIPAAGEGLRADEAPEGAIGIEEMCSVCQTVIEDDDERAACSVCKLPFHEECWRENLGCSAYGCSNVNALKPGPDIRVDAQPAPVSQPLPQQPRPKRKAVQPQLPWDHLVLGGAALATVAGFITCGAPAFLMIAFAGWRIAHNAHQENSIVMPVLSLILCLLGGMIGICLSSGFWMTGATGA